MVEGEGACCFFGGDQAVDGLCFSGEGVGGRTTPGGGQGDGACGVGVGSVKARVPPVGRRVVVTDEGGVGVGVHALFVWHSLVGGDGVWGAVAPVPFVVGGFQCDGDVVSEQVDDVSLPRVGDRYERGHVLIRVRDAIGTLAQTSTVRVDGGGGGIQNFFCCGRTAGSFIGSAAIG